MKRVVLWTAGIGMLTQMVAAQAPTTRPAGVTTAPATSTAPAPLPALTLTEKVNGSDDTPVIAYYGKAEITQAQIDRFIRMPPGASVPPDMIQSQRQQVLMRAIAQMIFESYQKGHPDLLTEQELDAEVKKRIEEAEKNNINVDERLKAMGMTKEDFRRGLIAELLDKKIREQFGSEEKVKDFYEAHKAEMDGTTLVTRHILSHVNVLLGNEKEHEAAQTKMEELKKQIESGKITFEKAMQDNSDDYSWMRQPTLPPFPRFGPGRIPEVFVAAVFAGYAKNEKVIGPIRTDFGWHLVEVVRKEPGKAPTFEEIKPALQQYLFEKARGELLHEELAKNPVRSFWVYSKPPRPPMPSTLPATRPAMTRPSTMTQPAASTRPAIKLPRRQNVPASQPGARATTRPAGQQAGKKAQMPFKLPELKQGKRKATATAPGASAAK